MYRKTYVEINTDNLKYNVSALISKYQNYGYYIGVVKGNVYGHGNESVKYLVESGINYLAVSSLEEALNIRKDGINTPILLLQPIHLEEISVAVKNDITITISNYEYFQKLVAQTFEKELKIHLKINNGFNRLGISNKEHVKEIFETLKQNKNFKLEGVYSHFMTSGRNDNYFENQVKAFKEITSLINLKEIPIVHLDRSLTLTSHEKFDFCTGMRVGIAMYGYNQTPQKQTGLKAKIKSLIFPKKSILIAPEKLLPAFTLFSEIIEINKVKKGERVGYGAKFTAERDCILACVPVGYSDGFFRKNKNGYVVINGKRYQIVTVDMNMITLLIDEDVKLYDKVEIFGQAISVKEVAQRNETIIYEILCAIKESVPRVFK